MTSASTGGSLYYFGKLPSRGDFVRSAAGTQVIHMLDAWLAQGLELLAGDPAWKAHYDAAPAVDFAFIGTRSRHLLAGRLLPSRDASQRRFPFIAAGAAEVERPLALMARAPAQLAGLWRALADLMRAAAAAEDPREALDAIAAAPLRLEADPGSFEPRFRDFEERQTLAGLEEALAAAGHRVVARQSLLALGLLLQPVLSNGASNVQKGLALPLPGEPLEAALAGSFWLDLIAPFFARAGFEIGLFCTRLHERPIMLLSFNGANPRTLVSLWAEDALAAHNVDLAQAEWVEEFIDQDYGIRKLASYMEHPQLSLRRTADTFREAFLGA